MINWVQVTNDLGESLEMGIWTPDKSGLLISNIEGLSPSSASINTTSSALMDGSEYNSAKFQERNIVISIIYNPAVFTQDCIENIRHLSYRYFPIKQKIRLTFNTDHRNLWIDGYVEDDNINIFSQMEEGSYSIICPDPYFRDGKEHRVFLSSTISLFEFPFSNESLDKPLLEFSQVNVNNQTRVLYEGDVDTGCVIRIEFRDYVHDLRLYNSAKDQEMRINTAVISDITAPKIVWRLVGIEDDKGEYLIDEYGNIIEGYVADVVIDNDGTLSALDDHDGGIIKDQYGGAIEGFLSAKDESGEKGEIEPLEDDNGLYLTDESGNTIEGYNALYSLIEEKKTIMVPIEDSDEETITGMAYDIERYAEKEILENESGDYILDSEGRLIDAYVVPNGIVVPLVETPLESELTPGIRPGDEIIINTTMGRKSAKLLRNNTEYNILGAISKDSDWIKIIRGYNDLGFWAFYGEDFVDVEFSYENLYAGV